MLLIAKRRVYKTGTDPTFMNTVLWTTSFTEATHQWPGPLWPPVSTILKWKLDLGYPTTQTSIWKRGTYAGCCGQAFTFTVFSLLSALQFWRVSLSSCSHRKIIFYNLHPTVCPLHKWYRSHFPMHAPCPKRFQDLKEIKGGAPS